MDIVHFPNSVEGNVYNQLPTLWKGVTEKFPTLWKGIMHICPHPSGSVPSAIVFLWSTRAANVAGQKKWAKCPGGAHFLVISSENSIDIADLANASCL